MTELKLLFIAHSINLVLAEIGIASFKRQFEITEITPKNKKDFTQFKIAQISGLHQTDIALLGNKSMYA